MYTCMNLGVSIRLDCILLIKLKSALNILATMQLYIQIYVISWVYPFTGLDYWTGILDWNTGLSYFPFLNKFLCLFLESSLHFINK